MEINENGIAAAILGVVLALILVTSMALAMRMDSIVRGLAEQGYELHHVQGEIGKARWIVVEVGQ